jgi:regulator of sigma E protease
MFITILSFLTVLLVLIIAHEVGHFVTARIAGVRVDEFGIFMPPRIASFKRNGIVYSLNALPLGGFVKLAGEEDPDELIKRDKQKEPDKSENTDGRREIQVASDRIEKQSKFGNYIRSILWLPASGTEDAPPKKVGKYVNPLYPHIWDKPLKSEVQTQAGEISQKPSGSRPKSEPGTLAGKSIPVRILVLGAGSLMNFILPLLLLSIALMLPHQEFVGDQTAGNVLVEEVAANSPASQAGIKAGDYILSVNGVDLTNASEYAPIINQNLGKLVTVELKHADGTASNVTLTPRENPPVGEGKTGIAIGTIVRKSYPFWEAIPKGAVRYWQLILAFKDGIVQTVRGVVPFEVSGPVGIAQATGQVVRTGGISALLVFAAFISLNLGIVNIFPLPALDGGRIAFVVLEWLRHGKRVSPKVERMVHTIGFLLLMALVLVVTYRDIVKL